MAVTLPLVLILLDYYHNRKINRNVILEKVPFLAVSIIFGIVSINAAGTYGHIENLSATYNFLDRIFLFTYGIGFYLFKALIPVNLSAIYSYPFKDNGLLPMIYYLSPILIVALTSLVVYVKKLRKELVLGLLFFLFSIAVVLPFYWSRTFIMAERYSYLSYIGLYLILTAGISKLFEKQYFSLRKFRPYIGTALLIILVVYISLTVHRTKVWKDTEILLTDVIDKPHDAATHSYGYYYRANYLDMTMEFDKAIEDYNQAILLNPDFILAYNNRGIVKGLERDFEGAVKDFTRAIERSKHLMDISAVTVSASDNKAGEELAGDTISRPSQENYTFKVTVDAYYQ